MELLNMRERADLIGAELNIAGSQEKVTIIELKINLNAKENINS